MFSFANLGRAALAAFLVVAAARAETILVPRGAGSAWRYLDAMEPPAGKWFAPEFTDEAWPSGPAPLGYGEEKLGTVLKVGEKAERKPVTAFFRRTFEVKELAEVALLGVYLNCDDGARVFLNGEEIARWNLPTGAIQPTTLAAQALADKDEGTYHRFVVPAKERLRAGANTLAVEVHQAAATSSDLFFDLEVKAWKASEGPDVYSEGVAALRAQQWRLAAELLGQTPPEHPDYVRTMERVGVEIYGRRLGEPAKGLPFVERAYARRPGDMEMAYTWVRAHVAARQGLTEKITPRPLPKEIPAAWRFITDAPKWPDVSQKLPSKRLLEELDYLEEMIANCYAYADRRGVDWRGALDALRASLGEQIGGDTYVTRLSRFMTIFGDPHSGFRVGTRSEPRGRIPVQFVEHAGKFLAVKADRSDFVDPACPVVTAIDGIAIDKWLAAAALRVPQASPHYARLLSVHGLAAVESLGWEVGRKAAPECELSLVSLDGKKTGAAKLALEPPKPAPPRGAPPAMEPPESRKIGEIGYLRIPQMATGPAFTSDLNSRMAELRDTRGLIIDVRGNGGGSQDAINTMLPYFMRPEDPIKIINVAAYRLPLPLPQPNPEGFLGMSGRSLFPATSKTWRDADRTAILAFLKDWKPKWTLPAGKFSDWHVMGVRATTNPQAWHYAKPVVVLMDTACFSATDNFLGALKGHRNVTLLGTASGGGSGRMTDYQLPNSKIPFVLCQMASFATTGLTYDGNGVAPDVVVEPGWEDALKGKPDTQLAAALERLKK